MGTFILVFTVFGVIHRKATAGFAGVAIGLVVFAAIIPVAPTTGASINPARTFGPMLVQQIAGGTVTWSQLPVYLAAELLAGVARGLRLRRDLPHPRRRGTRRVGHATIAPPSPPPQPEERDTVKKLINDPGRRHQRGAARASPPPTPNCASTTPTGSSTAATRRSPARSG